MSSSGPEGQSRAFTQAGAEEMTDGPEQPEPSRTEPSLVRLQLELVLQQVAAQRGCRLGDRVHSRIDR